MKRIEAIRKDRTVRRKTALDNALVRLRGFAEPLGLVLVPFGSYAKGRVRSQSDLDVAIPGIVSQESRRRLEREAERVEADEGVQIDLMFESEIPTYFTDLRDTLTAIRSSACSSRREACRNTKRKSKIFLEGNMMTGTSSESPLQQAKKKLDRVSFELDRGDKMYRQILDELKDGGNPIHDNEHEPVGLTLALTLIVHNLYNGTEQILEDIAKIADDFDQSSKSSHADLIDMMAVKTPLRPAVLTPELCAMLHDLRKFRHVVRHSYGNPLITKEVMEKFESFRHTFWPRFRGSFVHIVAHLENAPRPDQGENPKVPYADENGFSPSK